MNRLIILCISILVAQLTYAQQVLFINGDAANPELYIEHGATGFLYIEGGLSAVNNGIATGTPNIVVNGGLFIFKQAAAAGNEGDIVNNTSSILVFDYDRATTATASDLTGTLPAIISASVGVSNALGGTVHLMTGTQEFKSSTSNGFRFYNLSLEGTGNNDKSITTALTPVEIGVATGATGNTGKLFLSDEYFNTASNIVWVRNTSTAAIERDPLGDGATGTTGMLLTDQDSSVIRGMVTSSGQGRLKRSTAAGNTYLFPVGSSNKAIYRPVAITSSLASNYYARIQEVNSGTNTGTAAPTMVTSSFYALINADATGTAQYRLYGVRRDMLSIAGNPIIASCAISDLISSLGTAQAELANGTQWGFQPASRNTPLSASENFMFYATSSGFPTVGAIGGGCSQLTSRTNFQALNTVAINNEGFTFASLPLPCYSLAGICEALPVELISFWGNPIEDYNKINWETASEQNTKWHIVERSDGIAPFNEIGRKPAAGFSNTVLNYSLLDEAPLQMSYYRLRTVDFDGKEQLSKTILIKREMLNVFAVQSIYPNPGNGIVTVNFSTPSSQLVTITMYDELGKLVKNEVITTNSGINQTQIDLRNFAASMLVFVMDNGSEKIYRKLIKLK